MGKRPHLAADDERGLAVDRAYVGCQPVLVGEGRRGQGGSAEAVDDDVAAGAAVERVVAGPADEHVVTGAAEERVVAVAAEEDVVAVAAVEREQHRARCHSGGVDHVVPGERVDRQSVAAGDATGHRDQG